MPCSICKLSSHNKRTCPSGKENTKISTNSTKITNKNQKKECTICADDIGDIILSKCCNNEICNICFDTVDRCPFCRANKTTNNSDKIFESDLKECKIQGNFIGAKTDYIEICHVLYIQVSSYYENGGSITTYVQYIEC